MNLIDSVRQEQANMYLKILEAISETNYFGDMGYYIEQNDFIHIDVNNETSETVCRVSDILEMNVKMDIYGEFVSLVIVTDTKEISIDGYGHRTEKS